MNNHPIKKLSVHTIGCRLNQYESEKIAAQLYPYGFQRALAGENADLYIVNTCTVTHRADSDCRNIIRRLARQNPEGRIVVTGCYVENDPEKISALPGVDVVIGNAEKDDIASILPRKMPELFTVKPDKGCSSLVSDFYDHNRAWLKISDGCNQWCSFCIIPAVRGRLKNRPPREIINEINNLVAHGYEEVVLTGVNTGHYKYHKEKPYVKNLGALCRLILKETDVHRLRISSIEPQTIRDEFINVYAEAQGRICRHLHIPLQSGSSRILKLMRRPYDRDTYIRKVTAVKEAVVDTIIGADVIVGFPGETDDDFNHTRELAESGLIDYLHVFSYSERNDTPASKMADKVHSRVIKERNAILTKISNQLRFQSHQRQIGEVLEVISEHKKTADGYYWGISGNYMRVRLPGTINYGKKIVKVKIHSATPEFVSGDVISTH